MSSGSPIASGDAVRRLLIPVLLAIVLAGCGGSQDEPAAPVTGARECADSWNGGAGDAMRYMADIVEAGGEEAFVGTVDGACVVYAENPGDHGEVYVFEERGAEWPEPKRADVPQRQRLESNAGLLEGGRIALD